MDMETLDIEVRKYIRNIELQKAEAQRCIAELTERQKAVAAENNLLHIQLTELKERYDLLLYKRFARSAEQLLKDKKQLFLFDEPISNEEEPGTGQTAPQTIKSYKRSARGRKPIDPAIPREVEIIDIPEADKRCACGTMLKKIGEEISERLEIVPPRIYVKQIVRPKYACPECEGADDPDKPTVHVAPAPVSIIPGSIVTPGLLSTIMIAKYQDHLPFYRQELQFERIGVTISRQDMAHWQQRVYQRLLPLFELLKQAVKSGPVMGMDETTVQVMGEEGRADTQKSYMWLARGGPPGKPVVLFEYRETRAAKHLPEFLEGFVGYLQTDGYRGYETAISSYPAIRHVGCFAHARRYFFEAAKVTRTSGSQKKGLAEEAIGYIKKLYVLEETLRKQDISLSRFLNERGKAAAVIFSEFKAWLDQKVQETPPSLLLGKAIGYTRDHWETLTAYTECAYLTPDNNACENALRPFVLGRKNWLFNKSPDGAKSSCGMYSLIETAKQNGLIPRDYLTLLFDRCPSAKTPEDWAALLPWNIKNNKKNT
ncbi:IS66 family transposase [Treponema primitia]|uniref:IS66 family transposase n=1 Tax=Treponema primitia TaxID=88058 RepID=UPI0002554CDE|nr:IS66 family transposase [Treponema primitia]